MTTTLTRPRNASPVIRRMAITGTTTVLVAIGCGCGGCATSERAVFEQSLTGHLAVNPADADPAITLAFGLDDADDAAFVAAIDDLDESSRFD